MRCVFGVAVAATAMSAGAQVVVNSVDRSVAATACVFAPPTYPEWCDSDSKTNTSTGHWINSVVWGNSAAGGVGFGGSITTTGQESTVTADGFFVGASARVELDSDGDCASTGLCATSMTVGFTALSPCRAVLSGLLNGANTAELRITLRRGDNSLVYTYAGNFDAEFDLAAGDYQYFASGIADGACSGSCHYVEQLSWNSQITFQPLACPADLNGDDVVDDGDFVIFVAAYNELLCPETPAPCPADLNHDGLVEDTDFTYFAAAYNELVCP